MVILGQQTFARTGMELKLIYILTLIFSLLYQDAFSQNRKVIDSLFAILKTTKPDTSHVKAYNEISYQYSRANLDTAMKYAHRGKVLAEELN